MGGEKRITVALYFSMEKYNFFKIFLKNRSKLHLRAVIGAHGKPKKITAFRRMAPCPAARDRRIFFYTEAFMNNLNSVLIEGNMVRDPLLRSTPRGASVCNFTIASNRYYKQDSNFEKEVGFFDVEAWGKLGDACGNLGKKGRGVRVVGRLRQDRWTGNDGRSHNKVAIVAEHVEYRPEFKKSTETDSETETLTEAATNYEASSVDDGVFSGINREAVDSSSAPVMAF